MIETPTNHLNLDRDRSMDINLKRKADNSSPDDENPAKRTASVVRFDISNYNATVVEFMRRHALSLENVMSRKDVIRVAAMLQNQFDKDSTFAIMPTLNEVGTELSLPSFSFVNPEGADWREIFPYATTVNHQGQDYAKYGPTNGAKPEAVVMYIAHVVASSNPQTLYRILKEIFVCYTWSLKLVSELSELCMNNGSNWNRVIIPADWSTGIASRIIRDAFVADPRSDVFRIEAMAIRARAMLAGAPGSAIDRLHTINAALEKDAVKSEENMYELNLGDAFSEFDQVTSSPREAQVVNLSEVEIVEAWKASLQSNLVGIAAYEAKLGPEALKPYANKIADANQCELSKIVDGLVANRKFIDVAMLDGMNALRGVNPTTDLLFGLVWRTTKDPDLSKLLQPKCTQLVLGHLTENTPKGRQETLNISASLNNTFGHVNVQASLYTDKRTEGKPFDDPRLVGWLLHYVFAVIPRDQKIMILWGTADGDATPTMGLTFRDGFEVILADGHDLIVSCPDVRSLSPFYIEMAQKFSGHVLFHFHGTLKPCKVPDC